LWQTYRPLAAFNEVALRLSTNDFEMMAERDALFELALGLAMNDGGVAPEGAGSVRVWLKDDAAFTPRRAETVVASDLMGGVYAEMWPYVARFDGVEGGTMRVVLPFFLDQPWNPIAGTNWAYDRMPIRAAQDYAFVRDPNDGLVWPQRAVEVGFADAGDR
jgi:peptide/nickel transport system substrate-binding protein